MGIDGVMNCANAELLTAVAIPEAEWVLSEAMTSFLDNFNLLRMFRVARIIRSRAAMSWRAKPQKATI